MSMSEEIKVGDRFEWAPHGEPSGNIATVVSLEDGAHWTLEGPSKEKSGHNQSAGFLLLSCWRRLPRKSTVEERRAALKVGDKFTSADQFEPGMKIGLRSYQGTWTLDSQGWRDDSGDGVRKWCFVGESVYVVWESNIPKGNFTFLGYADKPAPEVKVESTSLAPYMIPAARNEIADKLLRLHEEMREAAYAQVGIPQQSVCDNWYAVAQSSQRGYAEQWWSQNANVYSQPGQWTQSATKWGLGPEKPAPPAKALPFKRHGGCFADHSAPVMCLTCEALWAESTENHDRAPGEHRYVTAKPTTRERYEPQCGAFVGRVLTPVRR
jgi:hypothetical protein